MISLILPYYDRQKAADKALALIAKHYGRLIEVVVVDDGSPVPFRCNLDLDLKIIRLPTKHVPLSPVVPWNVGVKASSGDIIVLSCIEVLHEQPVLDQMVPPDPMTYVLAAAWCPEQGAWHTHSTVSVPDCPKGSGIGFCAALHRSLFDAAGGFDEDYREGAGYEDRDWIFRLHRAGAQFVHRDDLVVIHPKTGATTHWPAGSFDRNFAIYQQKWNTTAPMTLVCLKAGAAFGPEYVNILFDGLRRFLPAGVYRFVCITDDPTGLDEGIQIVTLPADLEKWWGKLYMFKRHLFPDGTRMAFFDLDTLIMGDLTPLVSYKGQFATLQDFYHPERLGPAIMLWEAGAYTASIWEDWVQEGKPRHEMGDLWWINQLDQGRFAHRADKLQKLFPELFCSFKAHCHPHPPKGAKVVCFHGQPRPHNCTEQWVQQAWKVGGVGIAELEIVANTAREAVEKNVRENRKRDIPRLGMQPAHGGHAVIVGGGPSVSANIDVLKQLQAMGHIIVALNGAAHYLKRQGILADWQVILDSRPENAAFILPDVPQHWICSQCDPKVFERLEKPTLYHVNTEATLNAIDDEYAELISTGSTVGLIAMGIAYTQGFRAIHLYGMDSSYTSDHHAYEQKMNDEDRVIEAVCGDRVFKCAPWMVAQVNQFQEIATQLADAGCTITVAGDGLLPYVARLMSNSPQEIA